MSATELAEAPAVNGEGAEAAAHPNAGTETPPSDGSVAVAAESGQDQSKAATLLTDEKPVEKAAPVVPEAYTIALPKESPIGADVLAKVSELAKGLSVTDSAHVQSIVDLIHGEAVAVMDAQQSALKQGGALWQAHVARLAAEALADTDIGGTPERLTQHVMKAQAVLKQYGSPEFAAMLEETGFGSHPALIKLLAKVNDSLGDDRLIQGEAPKPKPKTAAQAIYPNLPSREG